MLSKKIVLIMIFVLIYTALPIWRVDYFGVFEHSYTYGSLYESIKALSKGNTNTMFTNTVIQMSIQNGMMLILPLGLMIYVVYSIRAAKKQTTIAK